ncbi:MAG: zinc ribbon domain-containing protein [Planctomycetia bacterium]|nr:zinc ribbon domain-containing protein [Planctomycetia bacterium]
MPTYEYKCDACGKTFEELQSITAAPLDTCPLCNQKNVHRLLGTGAGFIFRGTGFYITDYKDKAPVPQNTPKTDSSPASS